MLKLDNCNVELTDEGSLDIWVGRGYPTRLNRDETLRLKAYLNGEPEEELNEFNAYEFNVIEELQGKVMARVWTNGDEDELWFEDENGVQYRFYHQQDCCESVTINDICGDLEDLVGATLIQAEEASHWEEDGKYGESSTWTFYRFATPKGSVTVKWLGSSNGYYSESVQFTVVD